MAKHNPKASTLDIVEKVFTVEHKSFSFETPHISCSLLEYLELITLSATCLYEGHNHLLILICKLFKRMDVDAFIYHKYCKSHSSTMALTL